MTPLKDGKKLETITEKFLFLTQRENQPRPAEGPESLRGPIKFSD